VSEAVETIRVANRTYEARSDQQLCFTYCARRRAFRKSGFGRQQKVDESRDLLQTVFVFPVPACTAHTASGFSYSKPVCNFRTIVHIF
jgi:hypothetical protein